VRSIPCFIVVKDGLEIQRKIGMQSLDQLKKLVE
jgi:thioredoxin-like negative regulator of GroEL